MPSENRDSKLQVGPPPGPQTAPAGVIISPDTERGGGEEKARIPPRQARTKKWPVLDAGGLREPVPLEQWRLNLFGLVEESVEFTWEMFQSLPRTRVFADMHCVTRWSRLGNIWEGVSTRDILQHVELKPEARFVSVHAYDQGFLPSGVAIDWATNMPLKYFLNADCLFADIHDGEPLSLEHGAPVRLVIPRLYAWKSAKWVRGIEFCAEDTPGFWEQSGFHMLGDPWKEQRHPDFDYAAFEHVVQEAEREG